MDDLKQPGTEMPKPNLDDFQKLLDVLKKNRVVTFNNGQVSLTFHPSAYVSEGTLAPEMPELTPEEIKRREEEVLFYSAV